MSSNVWLSERTLAVANDKQKIKEFTGKLFTRTDECLTIGSITPSLVDLGLQFGYSLVGLNVDLGPLV